MYATGLLPHPPNTRDATLSSKDIAISTYTKGEIGNNNDNNNIVSSFVHILTE